MASKPIANPMLEMLAKSMGFDPSKILAQAAELGAAFQSLQAGQAETLALLRDNAAMLRTLQVHFGLAPAIISPEMADLIAERSRPFLGIDAGAGTGNPPLAIANGASTGTSP